MSLEIKVVTNDKKGMKAFKKLPWTQYKDDPNWAPDLIMNLDERLNKKHPFFEFGKAEFFLALRDGEIVGRIAAIDNPRHVEYRKEKIGFWGFFECEDNQETANALFDAAKVWVRNIGYDVMRGPMSCDTQDEIGLVYEGFEHKRYFIMPHNPSYYIDLCENAGMYTAKNLICFDLDMENPPPEKMVRLTEIVKERMQKRDFIFRNLNKKNKASIVSDFRKIMTVYHEGWKDNWGFVPASERQFMELAGSMELVADKRMVFLVEGPKDEKNGERPIVAMAVALPDWMESTHWARKYPYGIQMIMQLVNLLWKLFLKPWPKFKRARLFLAGVMPEYRGQGMDVLLYVLPFLMGQKLGFKRAELSWELEDNHAIISPIEKMGAKVYRKLRIFDAKTK